MCCIAWLTTPPYPIATMTRPTHINPVEVEVVHKLSDIESSAWNRGVCPNDPFAEYAFLNVLEASESVGRHAGWVPLHLLAKRANTVVGAAPLYLKNNSYGEYIFDWGWAESAHHAGLAYYPKLVSAVPFTPASGRRLLTEDPEVEAALIAAMHGVAQATHAHSVHILFMTEPELNLLASTPEWIGRLTHQFHWDNDGYADFEHWLSRFRARKRKEVRRERMAASKTGATIRMLRGDQITGAHWAAIAQFYADTTARKQAMAYLNPEFFELAPSQLAHTALAFVAEVDNRVVAASLCFQRGTHLYGRYWGCEPAYRSLHFELCYHAPIAACIQAGWTHFEAGAQGLHKLQRGLAPAKTYSAHHLGHKGLHQAVATAVQAENAQVLKELEWLNNRSPFHRTPPKPR
jgi:predicted N-acyltransferase